MSDWASCVAEWRDFENSLKYANISPKNIAGVEWEKRPEWVVFLVLREGQKTKKVEIVPPALKSLVSYLVGRRFGDSVSIKISLDDFARYEPVFSDVIRRLIQASVIPPPGEEDPGYQDLCSSPPVGLFSHDKIIAVVSTKYTVIHITDALSKISPTDIEKGGWRVESSYIHPDVAYLRVVNPQGIGVCFVNGYTGKTTARVHVGIMGDDKISWVDMLSSEQGARSRTRIIHRGRPATLASETISAYLAPEITQKMVTALNRLKNITVDAQMRQWILEQIPHDWHETVSKSVQPGISAFAAIQAIYRAGIDKTGKGPRYILGQLALATRVGTIARELIKMQDASLDLFLDI